MSDVEEGRPAAIVMVLNQATSARSWYACMRLTYTITTSVDSAALLPDGGAESQTLRCKKPVGTGLTANYVTVSLSSEQSALSIESCAIVSVLAPCKILEA